MIKSVLLSIVAVTAVATQDHPTMHAIQYSEYGDSSVLHYNTVRRPDPFPGQVLIKVAAAGVNPVDVGFRSGGMERFAEKAPITPGLDVAGTIVAVGEGVNKDLVKTEVWTMLSWSGGGYAEYVAAPQELVVPKPKTLTPIQAGSLPLVGLTAFQALFVDGKLKSGDTILIHGAAGGVGHIAVQLAKQAGARVIGTASASNTDYLKSIGVDVVIDYKAERFEDRAKQVDFVLDTVGHDTLKRSYAVLRRGGTLISLLETPDAGQMKAFGLQGKRTIVRPVAADLNRLAQIIDTASIVPAIKAQYPLEKATEAQDALDTNKAPGKIVIVMNPTPGQE
jgi:NADPH:quinone reductase-like Zn-dependent oxidoreductase